MTADEGARLKDFVAEHARGKKWDGKRGTVGLAHQMNVTRQTIDRWYRGKSDPSLYHLSQLARALGVRRSEVLAAIDGDPIVHLADEAARRAVRAEVRAALREITEPPRR